MRAQENQKELGEALVVAPGADLQGDYFDDLTAAEFIDSEAASTAPETETVDNLSAFGHRK